MLSFCEEVPLACLRKIILRSRARQLAGGARGTQSVLVALKLGRSSWEPSVFCRSMYSDGRILGGIGGALQGISNHIYIYVYILICPGELTFISSLLVGGVQHHRPEVVDLCKGLISPVFILGHQDCLQDSLQPLARTERTLSAIFSSTVRPRCYRLSR